MKWNVVGGVDLLDWLALPDKEEDDTDDDADVPLFVIGIGRI